MPQCSVEMVDDDADVGVCADVVVDEDDDDGLESKLGDDVAGIEADRWSSLWWTNTFTTFLLEIAKESDPGISIVGDVEHR